MRLSSYRAWKAARSFLVVLASVFLVVLAFRLTSAGSLAPDTLPAGTMNSIEESYNALVGTFDSSSITGSLSGGALEVSRCIIDKINGSPCP